MTRSTGSDSQSCQTQLRPIEPAPRGGTVPQGPGVAFGMVGRRNTEVPGQGETKEGPPAHITQELATAGRSGTAQDSSPPTEELLEALLGLFNQLTTMLARVLPQLVKVSAIGKSQINTRMIDL